MNIDNTDTNLNEPIPPNIVNASSRRRFIRKIGALAFTLTVIDGITPLVNAQAAVPADSGCAAPYSGWLGSGITQDADCGQQSDMPPNGDGQDGDCVPATSNYKDNDCNPGIGPDGTPIPVSDSDCNRPGGDGWGPASQDSDCSAPAPGASQGTAQGSAGADDDCGRRLSDGNWWGSDPSHPDSDCPAPATTSSPKATGDSSNSGVPVW